MKQIMGRMNNIVLNEATLQSMECSELVSRKEKYFELKSSYDKRYEEFCELAENLDLQQFTSDTENALTELDAFEMHIDTVLRRKYTIPSKITPIASNNEAAKLPNIRFRYFDSQSPQLWFAQLEHQFIAHGLDENKEMAKFIIMSGLLEHEQAPLVSDITINSPDVPYTQAKKILVEAYKKSFYENLEQVFQEKMNIDEKPSQFLARFNLLMGKSSLDEIKRWYIMRDLPLHIQNILKHDKTIKTAEDLAKQADMLCEKETAPDVNVIRQKAKKDIQRKCYFHQKFGPNARKCAGTPQEKCSMWNRKYLNNNLSQENYQVGQ